ncbi:MAG: patatin-like phospholipase family protein [Candidatus Omnitrophota bacterium]|nr:patatin-like phospholipase family protein [Candidatus Omnitrophota bacterium]
MRIDKGLILKEFPLFVDLTESERNIIKENSHISEYKKGEVIYEEGSPPSAFYCLVLGRVVLGTKMKLGDRKIVEYLHRGKYFGIISLLTSEPHSVTAECLNDCLLLIIKKEDFDFVLKKVPSLAIDLSHALSRRIKCKDMHEKRVFESTIISVFSSYSQAGKTAYALNLALSLAQETHKSVIVLDIASLDKTHTLKRKLEIQNQKVLDLSNPVYDNPHLSGDFLIKSRFGIDIICFHYIPKDESCVERLMGILSFLINDYHYLIFDLPSSMNRSIFSVLNQSDLIQVLTSPDPVDLKRTHNLISHLEAEFKFNPGKINIVINEYKSSKLKHEEQLKILGKAVFATLPRIDFKTVDRLVLDNPACEYSQAVRRQARQLGDCWTGLVLGVGVGYGFCHVGVLKVIEEERIPIDVIAGSSVGALIASLWATGKTSGEILEISKEFKEPAQIWNLIDFQFPLLGFIKGSKLKKFLKKHLGDKTFYNTKLPLKIVASNVKRKETRILDKGSLVDAVMASCAIPGVFAPFRFKEEMLFDGGVISPLPTEPLLKMGIKKIIAVDVTPSKEDIWRQYERLKGGATDIWPPNLKKKRWFDLRQGLKGIFKLNILNIIFSSVEILQSEVAQKEALLADVLLHPDTSGMCCLELHRASEFAKRGEIEARKNLDKIWQLVNE